MTKRKAPDFPVDRGTWINPSLLSGEDRRELVGVLARAKGKKLDPELGKELVDFVNAYLQYRYVRNESTSSVRTQLGDVAKTADALLTKLESLSLATIETLSNHASRAVGSRELPIESEIAYRMDRIDETPFLDATWNYAAALKMIAEHAKEAEKTSKQDWPYINQARSLVANIALRYMQLTSEIVPPGKSIVRFGQEWHSGERVLGDPPPKSAAGWFSEFMAMLGEKLGVKIGDDIVESGIDMAANPTLGRAL